MRRFVSVLLFVVAVAASVTACAPRLAPPYRDYETRVETDDLTAVLRDAAVAVGWPLAPSRDPAIVSTEARRVQTGLLSRTDAALDLIPLSGGHVRIAVRAERRSVFGGRSKVYALDVGLQRTALGPITEALRERGLVPLGTPRDRDEDTTDGD